MTQSSQRPSSTPFELNDPRNRKRSATKSRSPDGRKKSQGSDFDVNSNSGSVSNLKALNIANMASASYREFLADKDVEMLDAIESNIAVATWIDNLGKKAADQSVSSK